MSRAYSSRATGPLTREEIDVRAALAGTYTIDGAARTDRIPAADLWNRYTDWWAANRWQWRNDPTFPGRYRKLSRKQFGAAVRRVFPCVRRERPMFRRRRYYAYVGLKVAD